MNFGFTRYRMPDGGSLSLYPPDHSRLLGPFTAADNEAHGQLWSPILLGDEIVIEISLLTNQSRPRAGIDFCEPWIRCIWKVSYHHIRSLQCGCGLP